MVLYEPRHTKSASDEAANSLGIDLEWREAGQGRRDRHMKDLEQAQDMLFRTLRGTLPYVLSIMIHISVLLIIASLIW